MMTTILNGKKNTQSMSYNFKQELEKIGEVNILGVKDGQHPTLLKGIWVKECQ